MRADDHLVANPPLLVATHLRANLEAAQLCQKAWQGARTAFLQDFGLFVGLGMGVVRHVHFLGANLALARVASVDEVLPAAV